jgi:hypothetical protein
MATLPLAFAELLIGAIVLDAGIKGDSIANVVQGKATAHGMPGASSSSTSSGSTGGSTSATDPSAKVTTGSYVNPFPGATPSRVDQGVDYTITKPVLAPGDFVVKHIGQVAGFGTYIAGQLLNGPLGGRGIYFAEGLAPAAGVHVGSIIKAGQPVADPATGPYGHGVIESGWANITSSWYAPLAQSTGGHGGGEASAAGASYNRFVHALGGPLGRLESALVGSVAGMGLP